MTASICLVIACLWEGPPQTDRMTAEIERFRQASSVLCHIKRFIVTEYHEHTLKSLCCFDVILDPRLRISDFHGTKALSFSVDFREVTFSISCCIPRVGWGGGGVQK